MIDTDRICYTLSIWLEVRTWN